MARLSSLTKRLPAAGSLGQRMMKTSGWTLLDMMARHGLRLASNLLMTRILLPEAFGLMAMVVTVHSASELLMDLGVARSIQRERDGDTTHFLRAAWIVQVLRSAIVSCVVALCAIMLWFLGPSWAAPGTIYGAPELPLLLLISAIVPLMKGAESPNKSLALRRLEIRRVTIVALGTQILGLATMYAFAAMSPTVWALLAGMLARSTYALIATHTLLPGPRMGFVWDREINERLWRFGKWIMGAAPLQFLATNADKLILGALLPASVFGMYVIAVLWIYAARDVLVRMIGQVGFAGLSEVARTRPKDVPAIFLRLQAIVSWLCVAAFLGFYLLGDMFIRTLYPDAYHQAGQYMPVLALGFLVRRFNPAVMMLMSLGDSRTNLIVTALRAAGICGAVPLGYSLAGMEGTLYAVALGQVLGVPYILYKSYPILGRAYLRNAVLWLSVLVATTIGVWVMRAGGAVF